jgi:hypothetical protein
MEVAIKRSQEETRATIHSNRSEWQNQIANSEFNGNWHIITGWEGDLDKEMGWPDFYLMLFWRARYGFFLIDVNGTILIERDNIYKCCCDTTISESDWNTSTIKE